MMKMKATRKIMGGALVAAVCGMAGAQTITVDGSTTVGPIAKAFAEYYMKANPGVNITVGESGSGNGAKSLINGTCDVATMSRPLKDSEKKSAEDAGQLPIEYVVALDGLAAVVHPSNPVKGLTIEQLRGIYTGEIRSWQDVGGPDRKIVVVSRDTNSGTYESFETLVMNRMKMAPSTEYVGSSGAVRDRVMNTPDAIGYVGLAFTEGVKPLAVNGVEPSPETVLDKTYPVARPLFMYTNGRPKDGTPVHEFVMLYKTADGKRIIEDVGYIPVR
jgi:phosphate transport system substrate-binding protein